MNRKERKREGRRKGEREGGREKWREGERKNALCELGLPLIILRRLWIKHTRKKHMRKIRKLQDHLNGSLYAWYKVTIHWEWDTSGYHVGLDSWLEATLTRMCSDVSRERQLLVTTSNILFLSKTLHRTMLLGRDSQCPWSLSSTSRNQHVQTFWLISVHVSPPLHSGL